MSIWNMRKSPGGNRNSWNERMNMGGDFTLLTLEARFSSQAQVMRKARPDKLCRDQSPRGTHTWVRDIMEQVEKLSQEL